MKQTNALDQICRLLCPLGLSALLLICGAYLGQLMPMQGENGWWDMRELPRFMASMAFGCGGLFFGLIGGYILARKLSTNPQAQLATTLVLVLIPGAFIATGVARFQATDEALAKHQAESRQVDQQNAVMYREQRKIYEASAAYREAVEANQTRLEAFRQSLGPILYPNATQTLAINSQIEYKTADTFETVQDYLTKAGANPGYYDPRVRPHYQVFYFGQGPMKGSASLWAQKDGTQINYNMDN